MQNKRLLIPTIVAFIISVSCFFYLKYSINQLEEEKIEIQYEQTEIEEPDLIGIGFSDIDIIQKIGSTFRFFSKIR